MQGTKPTKRRDGAPRLTFKNRAVGHGAASTGENAVNALAGKIAVVTGASAGIGEATARTLADAGATLVLAARREDRLKALAEAIGDGSAYMAIDLAEEDAPQRLFAYVKESFGVPDLIVHNAAVLHTGTIEEFDLARLRPMIAINYESVVRSCYIFARAMKEVGRGHIINISSIGANITAPGTGIYGGLKRAIEMFTDSLRVELAGSGVRVGLVAPGTTSTEIFEPMKAEGKPAWDSYIPALLPDDVARAVRYLAEQPPHANAARLHVYSASEMF